MLRTDDCDMAGYLMMAMMNFDDCDDNNDDDSDQGEHEDGVYDEDDDDFPTSNCYLQYKLQ